MPGLNAIEQFPPKLSQQGFRSSAKDIRIHHRSPDAASRLGADSDRRNSVHLIILHLFHTYAFFKRFIGPIKNKAEAQVAQSMAVVLGQRINSWFVFFLQLITLTMFEEDSIEQEQNNSQNSGSFETNEDRINRIKKSKNIRKDKVQEKRKQSTQPAEEPRANLTKDQKKELQKEKNRVAAQLSRDRQKKYLEDLEEKLSIMELQLQSRLCFKCKAAISDHSSTEDEHFHEESLMASLPEPLQNPLQLLNDEPLLEQLPLVRENSRNDLEWGNIGRYLCMVLVIVAVGLLSSSVEQGDGIAVGDRQVARLLTENNICSSPVKQEPYYNNSGLPSTLDFIQQGAWPFRTGTGEPAEECKANFWNNYLEEVRKQSRAPYDWNLVSCSNPNLVHISTVYDNSISSIEDKWTFLITNPTVSHTHIEDNGNHLVDEVSYLDGIYQLIAEKVVLKKVMGKNCLA